MNEMICPNCGKFLGVLEGEAQIKCPRCKQLTRYKSKPEPVQAHDPDPDLDPKQEDEPFVIH
jgi:phage FluMu protein Com